MSQILRNLLRNTRGSGKINVPGVGPRARKTVEDYASNPKKYAAAKAAAKKRAAKGAPKKAVVSRSVPKSSGSGSSSAPKAKAGSREARSSELTKKYNDAQTAFEKSRNKLRGAIDDRMRRSNAARKSIKSLNAELRNPRTGFLKRRSIAKKIRGHQEDITRFEKPVADLRRQLETLEQKSTRDLLKILEQMEAL